MTGKKDRALFRAVDANINRSGEGLRVIEDITRFVFNNKAASSRLKKLRHAVSKTAEGFGPGREELLKYRDSQKDAGRKINLKTEFYRENTASILASNFKRAEESLRVLEEISKIYNTKTSLCFKELRYKTYEAEKEILLKYIRRNK